jgi:hypothetical protein
MEKSKIFIASSGRTLTLAETLQIKLNDSYCEATVWTEQSRSMPGKSIMEMLENATREYDFAVIILAQDDVMTKASGEKLKARDNCVFEAGLFMAALGRERCFLVNSVKQEDLPSDLSGIISIPFTEPPNLNEISACTNAITAVSLVIKNAVQTKNRVSNRPLSTEQLLDREWPKTGGGELIGEEQVVVTSIQPNELSHKPALQLRKNIDADVQYIYFFEGSIDGAQKTCRLLQMILLAHFLADEPEPDNFKVRDNKMNDPANREQIIHDLTRICKGNNLKFFFLPKTPKLQYVIHNATNVNDALLYLKGREGFIPWRSGKDAYDFWDEMREMQGIRGICAEQPCAVFYGSMGFKIKGGDFYAELCRSMKRFFPVIDEQVLTLCCDGT